METIINKVSQSGILTIDLLQFRPLPDQLYFFDVKDFLQMAFLFREKDFRAGLKAMDWAPLAHRLVTVGCSNDAILPSWAYAYVAAHLYPHTRNVLAGTAETAEWLWWQQNLAACRWEAYTGEKVVLKASTEVPGELYAAAATRLLPIVHSLFWGEAGSPIVLHKTKA